MIEEIRGQIRTVLRELLAQANLPQGSLLVVGCSTSEVVGQRIGTASNQRVATALVEEIICCCRQHGVEPVFQACEHLNRALVLERTAARAFALDEVTVIPHPEAGGAAASAAMAALADPVVVEELRHQARAGIDIGHTLIGMHIKPVVVPVRTSVAAIGHAPVVCARSRPKLIGGKRALYPEK